MSASHELVAHSANVSGLNPALLIATAAFMGFAVNAKKLTPNWHHTINDGEVGVWLKKGSPALLPRYTEADVIAVEEDDLTALKEGAELSTLRHYKVADPGWYFVGPFRTLQTVDTADQPAVIRLEVESDDMSEKKMMIPANITWNVRPDGDHPVWAITRVKHIKRDKKDAEAKDLERLEHAKAHPLETQVLQICEVGLGKVVSGRTARQLFELTYLDKEVEPADISGEDIGRYQKMREEVQRQTIRQCAGRLIKYGTQLSVVEFMPVTRTNVQVQADALRTLGVLDAAVAGPIGGPDEIHENIIGDGTNIFDLPTAVPDMRAAGS